MYKPRLAIHAVGMPDWELRLIDLPIPYADGVNLVPEDEE